MTSQTSAVLSPGPGPRDKRHAAHQPQLPVAAARKVEPRFDDNSVNHSLVIANIGESVALHCRIWMKQVWFYEIVQIVMSLTHSFPT